MPTTFPKAVSKFTSPTCAPMSLLKPGLTRYVEGRPFTRLSYKLSILGAERFNKRINPFAYRKPKGLSVSARFKTENNAVA